MIIDIHAHTSDHLLHGLHTDKADLEYLRSQAKKFGINKIYLMATYFPLKKSGLSNQVLLEKIKGDPLFDCFGSLDMENNFLAGLKELTDLATNKLISGIKLYPGYQNITISDPKFSELFKLAEKYQLAVACHLGELHHCCPRQLGINQTYRCGKNYCLLDQRGNLSRPEQLGLVAKNFPKVNFIACHMASPHFEELRKIMSESDNIYTDISGQFLSGTNEDTPAYRDYLVMEMQKFLELNKGEERLLFGTDFPIQSYQDTLELVEALKIKAELRGKILYQNSLKLLNLK